jgi:hypothetical protein
MSLILTTNDIKYKGIQLQTTSVFIRLEPLMSTKTLVPIYDAEGTFLQNSWSVKSNVIVFHGQNTIAKLEIEGISPVYYLSFTNPNDLNVQYVQIHESLIQKIVEQNPQWEGKIVQFYEEF